MSNAIIAQRYAKAYFDIALERDKVAEFQSELNLFASAWDVSEEFAQLLAASDVARSQRHAVLEAVAQHIGLQETTITFVKLLIDKRRVDLFPHVVVAFQKYVAEHAGQITAHVTTASPIHDATMIQAIQDAVAALKNKAVHIETHVAPEVLGGVMIRVGDEIFDGTIAAELRRMRTNLLAVEV